LSPDPNADPYPGPGTEENSDPDLGTPNRGSNADPDPKPWIQGKKNFEEKWF